MPEIPELEAHAERLDKAIQGKVLSRFQAISFTALKTFSPDPAECVGHEMSRISRRGKFLIIECGPASFVVHLMQGGRLRPDEKLSTKPRGGIARWVFEDGTALLLSEPGTERKAGVWMVSGDLEQQPPLNSLGPDANTLDAQQWGELLSHTSGRLHGVLRDQHIVAGIGRRLANEICHRAHLSPFANAGKLNHAQIESLAAAVTDCISESLKDERDRSEMVTANQRTSAVHTRVGEPCLTCGDTIRAVEYRAYTVAYCPTCQTGGKVLADNTTSKFLR